MEPKIKLKIIKKTESHIIFLTLLGLGEVYLWFTLPEMDFNIRLAVLGISLVLILILGESLYRESVNTEKLE